MLIKNGNVAFSDGVFRKVDLYINDGIIAEISANCERGDEEVIDAEGKLVFPGGIDPHVHFDDPGFTHREDFYTGTCAAAHGGITTVIDMPCTSIPPVTSKENLQNKLRIISAKAVVDYGLFGGVSGNSFQENPYEKMQALASDGVVGFKCYAISGMDSFPRLNSYQFEKVLSFSAKLGVPMLLHAEAFDYVHHKTEFLKSQEPESWQNYYESRSEIAEILAVKRAILQAESIQKSDLHIVHVGTATAVEMIAESRFTCETCPHYLQFEKNDFAEYGSALKTAPVVKENQKEALWKLLENGKIDFIASDHAPSPKSEKNTGSVWTDYGGIPGVETIYRYLFSEGFMTNFLDLKRFLEVTSINAAKRYGLYDRKGSIEIGKDADILIIDPREDYEVNIDEFYSKGETSPFNGMIFDGNIVMTMVRGNVVYRSDSGIIAEKGFGKFIRRG
jgi:allantoinase